MDTSTTTTQDTASESPVNEKFTVFKSRHANTQYILKDGTPVVFSNGKFLTKVKAHIKELLAEIHIGHPTIYQDADEPTEISDEEASPIVEMENRIRAQVLAELRGQGAGKELPNMGYYPPTKMNVGNSINMQATDQEAASKIARAVPIPSQTAPSAEAPGIDLLTGIAHKDSGLVDPNAPATDATAANTNANTTAGVDPSKLEGL